MVGKLYRGQTSSKNYESMMFNIFLCIFLNTGIVLLVVFSSFTYDDEHI